MRKEIVAGLILCGVSSLSIAQEEEKEFTFFFSLENRSYVEPTSIDSFIHEFDGDLEFGEYAFIHNTVEIGLNYSNWRLSYIDRFDHFYSFSDDTARFYYETENGLSQVINQSYKLDLKADFIKAKGFKVAYDWHLRDDLVLQTSASYLQADEIYDGQLSGTMRLSTTNSYDGLVNMNLLSHKDVILNYPLPQEPEGTGYAIDIALNWQATESLNLDLKLNDAFSQINWDGNLDSVFNATTAIRSFDANGKLTTSPTLSGIQRISNSKQELPEKLFVTASYQINDTHGVEGEVFNTEYFTHTTLAYAYSFSQDRQLAFSWGLDTQSVGIVYQNSYGRFGIETDTLDYEDAHTINLIFELNISL